MQKISIKREQSQAGLSFAEREKFRPQVKNKLFLLLALLLTAATGAWAQTTINVTAGDLGKAVCTDGSIYENVYMAQSAGKTAAAKIICLDTQNSKALALSLDNQAVTPGTVDYATAQSRCEALNTTLAVTFGTWVLPSKAQWEAMIEAAGGYKKLRDGIGTLFGGTKMEAVIYWSSTAGTTGHWRFNFNDGDWDDNTFESSARACLVINLPQTYSVTMKDGVKDADKWTVKVGEGQAQALPIGGLKGDGSETVTLQYNGRLKVKGVKATSDAAATAAAEGHALSASVVGEIVGSDGMAYAAADKDNLPSGVTAVAMVCYVDGNGHGLALAMADVQDKKMSWDNNRGANDGKTAAEWCTGWNTSHPITGATWLLASKNQWNNMISAAGSASNLSNAFSAVGGTNLQAFSYWSSTPNIGTSAWRYYFPGSSWSWTYLNQDNTGSYIRACLEW